MIRAQLERLMRMHGHLFPVCSVNGTSFVQFAEYDKAYLEQWLNRIVTSTRLLTFFIGEEVEEVEYMLPIPFFVAIAQFNGERLGLTQEETLIRISQNYRDCEWSEHGNFEDTMEQQSHEDVRKVTFESLSVWALDESRQPKHVCTPLKKFFEGIKGLIQICPKDKQIEPLCLRSSAG